MLIILVSDVDSKEYGNSFQFCKHWKELPYSIKKVVVESAICLA